VYTFIIIFVAACLVVYLIIGFIFYRAMIVNQKDEKTENAKLQTPRLQASRIPPRIEQKSAREAGVYHVLPVQKNNIVYSLTSAPMEEVKGEMHYAVASDTTGKELWKTLFYSREYIPHLETDVQNFVVVDLYLDEHHVYIKPEHGAIITLEKQTGRLLTTR
jgi:hypothetical protein